MSFRVGAVWSLVAAALLVPVAAQAIPVEFSGGVEIYGGEYSSWDIAVAPDGCVAGDTPPTGLAIKEAEYGASPRYTDAFDASHMIYIDGSPFRSSGDIGTRAGESVSAGPQLLGGLTVSIRHTALAKKPTVRTLLRLTNKAPNGRTITLSFHGNSGGDTSEDTIDTSDADDPYEPGEKWLAYTPGSSQPSDPTKITVLAGPGKVRRPVTIVNAYPGDPASATKDCLLVDYNVKVPAETTRYMLFFTRLEENDHPIAAGFASADFMMEKNYLFKGMTEKQRKQTLNWAL